MNKKILFVTFFTLTVVSLPGETALQDPLAPPAGSLTAQLTAIRNRLGTTGSAPFTTEIAEHVDGITHMLAGNPGKGKVNLTGGETVRGKISSVLAAVNTALTGQGSNPATSFAEVPTRVAGIQKVSKTDAIGALGLNPASYTAEETDTENYQAAVSAFFETYVGARTGSSATTPLAQLQEILELIGGSGTLAARVEALVRVSS